MKKELRKITNQTINELLNKEIIMPSIYFENFNKNARTSKINLEDESFNKELNEVILEDFNNIESYMNQIQNSASSLKQAAHTTKTALLNKDIDTLSKMYNQINNLEKEINNLNKKLFIDELTHTNNRKWIYNKFLDENANFKEDGIVSLLDIPDYSYINKEYGELLADNLLIFISNFVKKNLKEENIDFEIARFSEDKFFIFLKNIEKNQVINNINNIKQLLCNTNLKSNSGLFIKANYEYYVKSFSKKQDSKEIFESLFEETKKSKIA